MTTTTDRPPAVTAALLKIQDEARYASRYVEPGYTQPDKGIIIANWNDYESEGETLEAYGYELEWRDEWFVCDCDGAVRTQSDGFGWTPSYRIHEGEFWCKECYFDEVRDDRPAKRAENYSLDVYYEIVTPESASEGDAAERGTHDNRTGYTLEELVEHLKNGGPLEFGGKCWTDSDPDRDFMTGEETYLSYFVNRNGKPLTRTQAGRLDRLINPKDATRS